MKNNLVTAAVLALSLLAGSSVMAQADAQKKELASKIVTMQQGSEMDPIAAQLTGVAVAPMLQKWTPRLQADVPESRRKEVADKLNVELNKYREDTDAIIRSKLVKASNDVLVPAYAERFSDDELRRLASFFEDPAIKKYQAALPEMLNALVQQVVEASRAQVQARTAAFDETAAKIVGNESAKKSAPKKK